MPLDQVPRLARSLVPVEAVFELIVGSAVAVAATLIGPNPAVNLRALPVFGLLVEVVIVSRATKYLPSMALLNLMLERLAVTGSSAINVQLSSRIFDGDGARLQAYQVYEKVPVLGEGEPIQAPLETETVAVLENTFAPVTTGSEEIVGVDETTKVEADERETLPWLLLTV